MFNAITDKTAGNWFTHKGYKCHTERTTHTTTQPLWVINNLSFNNKIIWVGEGQNMLASPVLLKGCLGSFSPNPVSNRVCFTLEKAERHYSNGDKVGWQSLSPCRYVLLQTLNISPCTRRINKEINRRQAEEEEIQAWLHPLEDNKNNAFICCRASTLHQV